MQTTFQPSGRATAAMKVSNGPRTWSSGSPGVTCVILAVTEAAKSCRATWIEIFSVIFLGNSAHQCCILQALVSHTPSDCSHLVQSPLRSNIVLTGKLGYISMQMFLVQLVKRSLKTTFEYRPERFNPIRMRHVFHILPHTIGLPTCENRLSNLYSHDDHL